ncbi:MAG: hypothetical protein AAF334_09295, partial [Pseudomonadota bacterium]
MNGTIRSDQRIVTGALSGIAPLGNARNRSSVLTGPGGPVRTAHPGVPERRDAAERAGDDPLVGPDGPVHRGRNRR